MAIKRIQLYGADWCLKTAQLRNYLKSEGVLFDDFNVERDIDAASRVRRLYHGNLKFPTLSFDDEFLENPNIAELEGFLEKHKLKD